MSERMRTGTKATGAEKENSVSKMQKAGVSHSMHSPVEQVLSLQKTIGNQAVQKLIRSGVLQAKLRISMLGDMYEQEADSVAQQVIASKPPQAPHEGKVQIQRKTESNVQPVPVADNFIQNLGPGQPLNPATRTYFEPRFGHDFGHVRVHTDVQASESARAMNARAFTIGRDIVLGEGEYGAGMDRQRLMAHELTHVVQQKASDSKSIQFKEKEQDKVEQNIAAAKEAVTYTQKILYRGMGNPWNKWEDPRNMERYKMFSRGYGTKGVGIAYAAFIPELILTAKRMAELPDDNLLRDQIEEARESGDLQKVKQLQIKAIERTARLGEELGFGNCSEHASICYLYLRNRGTPRPIEMLLTADHAFVAIGRLAVNSPNPKDWNPDTVICDAYYDEIYSLKDGVLHERQARVEKTQGRLD